MSLIFLSINLFGQKITREFVIERPQIKISNSLYNTIKFVDSRIDTSNLGFVMVDKLNHKAKVIIKSPFSTQISKTLINLIDSSSKSGKLLFQLRQLKFSIHTSGTNERGYCTFNAILYSNNNNTYQKLASLDTIAGISAPEVSNAIINIGSQIIIDFIVSNIKKTLGDSIGYSYKNILNIDSIEKRKIKIYNTDLYTEGLYYSYGSFKDQIPDMSILVKQKQDSSISYVKIFENNKWNKIKSENVYAIVYHGTPYVATKFGYYQLNKSDDKLYFVGKVKPNANTEEEVGSTGLLGSISNIIVSNTGTASYFIILNHINGKFIYYKEMPGPGHLF